jgi:hypothetical protein
MTAWEYAIRLKLNGMLELMVCTDDVKSVVENRDILKEIY